MRGATTTPDKEPQLTKPGQLRSFAAQLQCSATLASSTAVGESKAGEGEVKLNGEFVWHSHEVEDELFLVLKGKLRMQLRAEEVVVEPGEFIVVPHGTEHRPVADEEVHVLLLEPKSTVNTGTAGGGRTRAVEWI